MKQRKIYYRRKNRSIIIEGKQDGKSVLIWTLPKPQDLLQEIMPKASFFTQEKAEKIRQKIERLDFGEEEEEKQDQEVRTRIIKRTSEKDAKSEDLALKEKENVDTRREITEEERKQLAEMAYS
ncbi:MAG: hypothetical protein FJZ63_02140 [Chlamydiae bacterium]|nr:hypothetical protein [Chlamydiota bacterium]